MRPHLMPAMGLVGTETGRTGAVQDFTENLDHFRMSKAHLAGIRKLVVIG